MDEENTPEIPEMPFWKPLPKLKVYLNDKLINLEQINPSFQETSETDEKETPEEGGFARVRTEEETAAIAALLANDPIADLYEEDESVPMLESGSQEAPLARPKRRLITRQEVVNKGLGLLDKRACNSCTLSRTCSKFQEGALCAFNELFEGLSTRRPENLMPLLHQFGDYQMQRAFFAMLQEQQLAGGNIDSRTTGMIDTAMSTVERIMKIQEAVNPGNTRLLIEERSDGSFNASMQGRGGKGILKSLLGAAMTTEVTSDKDDIHIEEIEAIDAEIVQEEKKPEKKVSAMEAALDSLLAEEPDDAEDDSEDEDS